MTLDSTTRLIAVRHGETDWNRQSRLQGHTDIGLNPRGHAQARRAAQSIAPDRPDAVYASDLARARCTAESIAAACGLAVTLEPALRERQFGLYEGLTFEAVEAQWPEQAQRWRQRDPAWGPPGGEVLADFHQRAVDAVARIAAAHPGQCVVIVSHGGVLDSLYRASLRIDLQAPRTWLVGNASINRLLFTPAGLSLVGWNDDAHLDDLDDLAGLTLDETSR
jgi:probable phosphoglycerate mutase